MIKKYKTLKLYSIVIFFVLSYCAWAQNDFTVSEYNEFPSSDESTYTYEFSVHLNKSFELAVNLITDENSVDISDEVYENFLRGLVDRLFRAYLTFRGTKEDVHPQFFRAFSLHLYYVIANLKESSAVDIARILDDPLGIDRWPPSSETVFAELPQRITLSGLRSKPDLYRELVDEFYDEIGFDFKDGKASVRTDRR